MEVRFAQMGIGFTLAGTAPGAARLTTLTLNGIKHMCTRKPVNMEAAEREAILLEKEVTAGLGVSEPSIWMCWYLSWMILPAEKEC